MNVRMYRRGRLNRQKRTKGEEKNSYKTYAARRNRGIRTMNYSEAKKGKGWSAKQIRKTMKKLYMTSTIIQKK